MKETEIKRLITEAAGEPKTPKDLLERTLKMAREVDLARSAENKAPVLGGDAPKSGMEPVL